ncbi:MAG: phage tail protein, partial [Candidatus Avilachnospira sp.]
MALNSITYNGLTYLAGLVASGSALKISRVAVGTGILPTGYDPAAMTDLIAFKQDADISEKSHEGTTAIISAQVTPASGDDFAVTEVGIYATDDEDNDILYAYADLSDHPQPIYSDTSGGNSGTTINTKIFVSSVSQIIADISPVALVTRRVFDLYIGTPDDYSNQKTYAEGAYCVRNNSLYRCTSEIYAAEEWTESHWEAITILGEIGSLMYPEFDDSGTVSGITDFNSFYNSLVSKMSIFDFFRNLKAGLKFVLNVGQLVTDTATNNDNLPAAASAVYKNAQAISKLNADVFFSGS